MPLVNGGGGGGGGGGDLYERDYAAAPRARRAMSARGPAPSSAYGPSPSLAPLNPRQQKAPGSARRPESAYTGGLGGAYSGRVWSTLPATFTPATQFEPSYLELHGSL
jgi:hypothetical protein